MNKKHIIIFGTLILLLIIIFGGITYYNHKGSVALLYQKDGFIPEIPDDKKYEIWCFDGEKWNDCSTQESFRPHHLISISVNFNKFDNIPYDPYYLCYYSDLSNLGKQCFSRSGSAIEGVVLAKEEVPENDVFSLIKVSAYPDDNFLEDEEVVIMDLEGKSIQ